MSVLLARQEEIRQSQAAEHEQHLAHTRRLIATLAVREAAGDEMTDQDSFELVDLLDEVGWSADDYKRLSETIARVRNLQADAEEMKAAAKQMRTKRVALAIAKLAAEAMVSNAELAYRQSENAAARLNNLDASLDRLLQNYPELQGSDMAEAIAGIPAPPRRPPAAKATCPVCGREYEPQAGKDQTVCGFKCAGLLRDYPEECRELGIQAPKAKPAIKSSKKPTAVVDEPVGVADE